MAITFKTEGIIIKTQDYKDADRLYTIFTSEQGKIILRAQGVKKINSKLAGHLEPITKSDLFIAQAKGFPKLAGANTLCSYNNIKVDLDKLNKINYCLKIIDTLVPESEKDTQTYKLLTGFLDWINDQNHNDLIMYSFILKLFNNLGYQQDFSKQSGDLAKILNFMSRGNWQHVQKLRVQENVWKQLKIVLHNFIQTNSPREITSVLL